MHFKIITFKCLPDVAKSVELEFSKILQSVNATNIAFSGIEPYWKIENYGEMSCRCEIPNDSISALKNAISSKWENDVTDSRWAKIFSNDIYFIWMTD